MAYVVHCLTSFLILFVFKGSLLFSILLQLLLNFRYANRAKNIKNKAKINEDPKDALLREFQKEIEKLRQQLEDGERVLFNYPTGKTIPDEV